MTGANEIDAHLVHVRTGRDFPDPEYADLQIAGSGDSCPRCGDPLREIRGIELGHTFKLGTKYSKALQATYLDSEGNEQPIIMGCYGIGVTRTIAAIVEQNHDEHGIIFPLAVAPYQVHIVPVEITDEALRIRAEEIYQVLSERGIEVLFDDRPERAGVKFKDADLIGIPIRITVGKRNLEKGMVEVKLRKEKEPRREQIDTVCKKVEELVRSFPKENGIS